MTRGDIFEIDACKTRAIIGTGKFKVRRRRMGQPARFHICLLRRFGDRLMTARQRLVAA